MQVNPPLFEIACVLEFNHVAHRSLTRIIALCERLNLHNRFPDHRFTRVRGAQNPTQRSLLNVDLTHAFLLPNAGPTARPVDMSIPLSKTCDVPMALTSCVPKSVEL